MPVLRIARGAIPLLATVIVAGCSTFGFGDKESDGSPPPPPMVEVTFTGLDATQESNARAYLGLAEEPCDAPEWRIRQRFAAAEADIARGLKPLGYYQPRIDKTLERKSPEDGEACWQAVFKVDPGAQLTVTHTEIVVEGEAASDPEFTRLLADLPLKKGDALNHGLYESSKRKLASLAAERGYQEARLTRSKLVVDPQAGTSSALITLSSGPRYQLGEVTVKVEALDEDLVRRIMEYKPGQPYSADRLHRVNQALTDSGYFNNVDVRANPDDAQDLVVPVTVSADARKRHLYTAGAGYATDTGPRIRLGYENRRINRRGHRVEARLRASLVQSDFTTEYQVPLDRPRSEWLVFSASASHEDTDSFESNAARLGVRATHERGRWLETRFLDLSRDKFEVGATRGVSTFLTPGISYARTHTVGGNLRPDRGWRLFGEVRVGAEALLSEANVLRTRISAGWLHSLPWDGRIITRAEVGALVTNGFKTLPPSLRFFAGGDNSVRGYEFESLGPKDSTNQVVGGRYLGVVSLEYEHPIQGAWSAAVFVDAGNAFDNDLDEGVKTGIGAGLRWQSPVGPIRVDLAHPLNDDDTVVRLHLRIGPDL